EQLELGRYLRLGRGEEKSGGRNKAAILVDALEAILGAVYLDAGLEPARSLILQHVVLPELEKFATAGTAARITDYKSALQESLQWLLGVVTIAIFIVSFIVQAFQIPSESMENTLLIGDYLLVDKLHFGADGFWERILPYRKVKRGDIAVFHYPVDPRVHFVKRVIGVPGDHIRLVNRRVYVNAVPAVEPYVHYFRPHDSGPEAVFRDDFPRLNLPVAGLNGAWWLEMKKLVDNNEL